MSDQPVDGAVDERVVEYCPVDIRRMNIIDAASGGRFHHAMSDQRSRAQAFERLLRWQRMRHGLMAPGVEALDNAIIVHLRSLTPSAEHAEPRPTAVR